MPKFETRYEQDKWDSLVDHAEKASKKIRSKKGTKEDLDLVSKVLNEFNEADEFDALVSDLTGKAKKKAKGKDAASTRYNYKKALEEILRKEAERIADLIDQKLDYIIELIKDVRDLAIDIKADTEDILDILGKDDEDPEDDGGDEPPAPKPPTTPKRSFKEEDNDEFSGSPNSLLAQEGESPESLISRLFDEDDDDGFLSKVSSKFEDAFDDLGFVDNSRSFVSNPRGVEHYADELQQHNNEMVSLLDKFGEFDLLSTNNEKEKAEEKKANIWLRRLSASRLGQKVGSGYQKGKGFFKDLLGLFGKFLIASILSGKLFTVLSEYLSLDKMKELGLAFYNTLKSNVQSLVRYISDKLSIGKTIDKAKGWISNTTQSITDSVSSTYDNAVSSVSNFFKFGKKKDKDKKRMSSSAASASLASSAAGGGSVPGAAIDSPGYDPYTSGEVPNITAPPAPAGAANPSKYPNASSSSTTINNEGDNTQLSPSFSLDNRTSSEINVPSTPAPKYGEVTDASIQAKREAMLGITDQAAAMTSSTPNINLIPTSSSDVGLGILNAGALAS